MSATGENNPPALGLDHDFDATILTLRSLATAAIIGAATAILPGAGTQAADLAPVAEGRHGLQGIRAPVDVPFSQTIKELQFGVMGAADLRIGKFGAYINGEYGKIASDKHISRLTFGVGTKNYLISGGVYYRIYETALGGNTVFGTPRVFAIEPTVGLRWTELETKVRLGSLALSNKESWLDPFVGTRLSYDLTDRWNFALEADVGGFGVGSRLSLNRQAAFGYRTTLFGVPTTLKAGYRILHQDYRDGGFQWKVTQHGPIVGAAMQF